MQSGTFKRKWRDLHAGTAAWLNGNSQGWGARDPESQHSGEPAAERGHYPMPRLLSGLLVISAILMMTYVAANSLVNSFLPPTRISHAMVEQHAASDYRKARVRCQQLSAVARENCINEAHAAEARSRAIGTVQYRDYVSSLREMRNEKIDAGDNDSIIVEPACNIVARGTGSLCEIQVKPGGSLVRTNLIPATATTRFPTYAAAAQPQSVRVRVQGEPAAAKPPVTSASATQNARRQHDQVFELAWSNRQ